MALETEKYVLTGEYSPCILLLRLRHCGRFTLYSSTRQKDSFLLFLEPSSWHFIPWFVYWLEGMARREKDGERHKILSKHSRHHPLDNQCPLGSSSSWAPATRRQNGSNHPYYVPTSGGRKMRLGNGLQDLECR
jgi:hypothetical protein